MATVLLRLPDQLLADLDIRRGGMTRSAFVIAALKAVGRREAEVEQSPIFAPESGRMAEWEADYLATPAMENVRLSLAVYALEQPDDEAKDDEDK
jgi:hypothetical protein